MKFATNTNGNPRQSRFIVTHMAPSTRSANVTQESDELDQKPTSARRRGAGTLDPKSSGKDEAVRIHEIAVQS